MTHLEQLQWGVQVINLLYLLKQQEVRTDCLLLVLLLQILLIEMEQQ